MVSTIFLPHSEYVLEGPMDFSEACRPIDGIQTLPELFAYSAQQHAQRPALSCIVGGSLHTLSYSELAENVRSISDMLQGVLSVAVATENVPPVVGIWFERSADLTVAVLAATTAGLTWLPFDPDAPEDRVKACLRDSKAKLLLCDDVHSDRACNILQSIPACTMVRFNESAAVEGVHHKISSSTIRKSAHPHDPAYLIYTSGSKSHY